MTRSTLYFLSLFALVGGSLLLRIASPSTSLVQRVESTQSIDQPPQDFVAHPWVAPGEEHHGPGRIISLAPSITEVICALGLRDRLVGRTQYCLYPTNVEHVTTVGALQDTNYEKIKSLQPDIVFVTENSYENIQKLRAIGLRVEPIPHETLEEVYTGITRVGDLCDRPRTARALVGCIWADVDHLRRVAAAHPHPEVHVLMAIEVRVPPQTLCVAGPGTFLDTLLHLAGYTNATTGEIKYPDLPLEKLVDLNPDVILDFGPQRTSAQSSELLAAWQQIPGLRAIQNRHVVQLGGQEWLSAGPRIAIELHKFISLLGNSATPEINDHVRK